MNEQIKAGLNSEIFNINKKRATEIFDIIIAEKIKIRIHFPNGLRGDIMDEEFIDKMVEAGVISVAYAFETPSPRIPVSYTHLTLPTNREV